MGISKITFRSGKLFPFQFQYFGIVLSIFTLLLLFLHPYFSPLPLIPALIIFTGSYGLEINSVKKKYRTYNSILFIKTGHGNHSIHIEMIFLTSSSQTQKVYTRVTEGPTIRKKYYNAYLKFGGGYRNFSLQKKLKFLNQKPKNSVIKLDWK